MTTPADRAPPTTLPATLADLVRHAARRHGAKTALVFEDQRWSFAQLDAASDAVAANLAALGVRIEIIKQDLPNDPRRDAAWRPTK